MSTQTREPRNAAAMGRDGTASRDELLRQVAQRLGLVQRLVRLAMRQYCSEQQLGAEAARMGGGQYHALMELGKVERLMAGELAERCHVSEPTISKMLKSLEASGFIERHTDPSNRRVVWVSLTPAGREMRERSADYFQSALARALGGLNNAELNDLLLALGHLERIVGDADTAH
jgi:DNA-binding MarR family transcriptional regulator